MNKKDFARLCLALSLSYTFIILYFFIGTLVDFLPEYSTSLRVGLLFPSYPLVALQWLINFSVIGYLFYMLWENGHEDLETQFVTALLSLHMALFVSWPFVYYGLKSFELGYIVIILQFATLAWTMIHLRKFSELHAAILAPVVVMNSLYFYSTLHGHILNPFT